ncbi:carbonic anhydrase-related protein 10-like [Babylonia areolata]|uniref:carbonic anhydrase-related protein 10-like n=1 Tax=Babylonia areolata TaxID=304850 RepID=UPI003FD53091
MLAKEHSKALTRCLRGSPRCYWKKELHCPMEFDSQRLVKMDASPQARLVPSGRAQGHVIQQNLRVVLARATGTRWHQWWEYEGLNGPQYWGMVNPEWVLCKEGRQQSPIDVEPSRLLFDPNLKHLQVESAQMKGLVTNTGNDITVELQGEGFSSVNISLGPLSYRYRAAQIKFHFSNSDSLGSEHHIAGKAFPVEMHVIAYNSDLYANITSAMKGVKGIVILAVFMEIGKEDNKPFFKISHELKRLQERGSRTMVHNIDIKDLLPRTDHYITYDGSLTQPGCYETVTWILYNKPLTISRDQLSSLRVLYSQRRVNEVESLEVNARPLMPLNHRVVRTNINTKKRSRLCTMEREMYYQVC